MSVHDLSLSAAGLAFAAGFVSFLSPCVLPLLPVYLSYISGVSVERLHTERWAVLRGPCVRDLPDVLIALELHHGPAAHIAGLVRHLVHALGELLAHEPHTETSFWCVLLHRRNRRQSALIT